jgi:hypothetical protein
MRFFPHMLVASLCRRPSPVNIWQIDANFAQNLPVERSGIAPQIGIDRRPKSGRVDQKPGLNAVRPKNQNNKT